MAPVTIVIPVLCFKPIFDAVTTLLAEVQNL